MYLWNWFLFRLFRKKDLRLFTRLFYLTAARYGLADNVSYWLWPATRGIQSVAVFRVTGSSDENRILPLPEPLVEDLRRLFEIMYGQNVGFREALGKTFSEVLETDRNYRERIQGLLRNFRLQDKLSE
uniref:Uncharacterized protein n=1 Tax=Candidatus Giovannonibacteria bacterium GW2011_GWF2_42_19 TaxID=1618659 RepID=A0A0G1CBF7_9BACT|nr:MAG: hypothetical protein UV11_C0021G0009 [Candidatus Giovannonibacteria bacterium GW2011_GWF2_42_19]